MNKKKKIEKGSVHEFLKEHYDMEMEDEEELEKLQKEWNEEGWDGEDWLKEK